MSTGGRTQNKHWFYSRWFIICGVVVVILLLVGFGRAWYEQHKVRQEIDRLESETRRLETQKLETLEALQYTQSQAFVEEKARTELNLVKPGERMAVIGTVGSSAVTAVSGQGQAAMLQSSSVSNLQKWWEYFFGPPSADESQ